MGNLIRGIIEIAEKHFHMEALPVDTTLSHIHWLFGLLDIRFENRRADGIRKFYSMELTMRIPGVHQQGIAFYPDETTDMPALIIDLTHMKNKTIAYVNTVALFDDDEYRRKHLAVYRPIAERYADLPRTDLPKWMQPHQNENTFFAMTSQDCYNRFEACAFEYAELYCERLHTCHRVDDPAVCEKIAASRERFRRDIAEKDTTRHLLAKIIGRRRADRIFQEVLT